MCFKEKKLANVVVLRGEEENISKNTKQYLKRFYLVIVSCDGDISSWCCFLQNHQNEIFFFVGNSEYVLEAKRLAEEKKMEVYHLPE